MARSKAFDDADAVRAARGVFWERGYAATSLAQLEEATGLNRSSLYATYESKRRLFDYAIDSYLDEVVQPLLGVLEEEGAGQQQLVDYFLRLANFFHSADPRIARRGCLLLNTAMELNSLDVAAAERVRAYRLRVRAAFLSALLQVPCVTEPDIKADLLTAGQIGLMLTSRLDLAQAEALARAQAAEVKSW